jgi:hypothetical protein
MDWVDWIGWIKIRWDKMGWIRSDGLDWTRWIGSDKLDWIRKPAAGAEKNEL